MFTKRDVVVLKKMEKNWLDFVNLRNKKKFEHGPDAGWLSVLDREKMISEFVRIFQTIKQNKVVYE